MTNTYSSSFSDAYPRNVRVTSQTDTLYLVKLLWALRLRNTPRVTLGTSLPLIASVALLALAPLITLDSLRACNAYWALWPRRASQKFRDVGGRVAPPDDDLLAI